MTDITLTSLRHRDVLDVSSATVIGRVDDILLDLEHRQVAALIIGKGPKGSPVLVWDRVVAIGPDAVTVDGTDALRPPDGAREELAVDGELTAVRKAVLTTEGDDAGELEDLVIDAETGSVSALVIDGDHRSANDLVAVGGFAAIVRPGR